jgi:hypothetical protein
MHRSAWFEHGLYSCSFLAFIQYQMGRYEDAQTTLMRAADPRLGPERMQPRVSTYPNKRKVVAAGARAAA